MPDGTDLPIPAEGVLGHPDPCQRPFPPCMKAKVDPNYTCIGCNGNSTHMVLTTVPAVSLAESNRRVEAERQRAIDIVKKQQARTKPAPPMKTPSPMVQYNNWACDNILAALAEQVQGETT